MINRRVFVRLSSAAGLAAVAGNLRAQEALQALPTDNPQAVALKYVEDVSSSAPDGYPAGSGNNCANCMHYKSLDADWGTCALFPTFKVKGAGWCSAWVAQP